MSEYFNDKDLLMQAQEIWVVLDEEQLLFLAGGQDNAIDEDVDEQPVQDLALNVDNVFQADDCDAYDSDVDEAPTAQTMFMANLSSADPVRDEAGPSYDSDVLSEVHDHDHYQDAVCDHHEEHEMHDDVQPNHVVESHADYTSDSNMTPYDQYVKDNAAPVVQNNASMVPNDAYVMIDNDVHKSDVLSVSHTPRNTVANNLLNAELATYKEQTSELSERGPDIVKMKAEALKEQNTRPIKALDVYLYNYIPATLVPDCFPTKSQGKINIFTLRLFFRIGENCKKRITLTGITEGEREVKEMSDAFDELEAELDQSVVDRKHDEIERKKHLLVEHDI
ncbi:hypothetical protein Tco_0569090 [Tanacetum coccineum]